MEKTQVHDEIRTPIKHALEEAMNRMLSMVQEHATKRDSKQLTYNDLLFAFQTAQFTKLIDEAAARLFQVFNYHEAQRVARRDEVERIAYTHYLQAFASVFSDAGPPTHENPGVMAAIALGVVDGRVLRRDFKTESEIKTRSQVMTAIARLGVEDSSR